MKTNNYFFKTVLIALSLTLIVSPAILAMQQVRTYQELETKKRKNRCAQYTALALMAFYPLHKVQNILSRLVQKCHTTTAPILQEQTILSSALMQREAYIGDYLGDYRWPTRQVYAAYLFLKIPLMEMIDFLELNTIEGAAGGITTLALLCTAGHYAEKMYYTREESKKALADLAQHIDLDALRTLTPSERIDLFEQAIRRNQERLAIALLVSIDLNTAFKICKKYNHPFAASVRHYQRARAAEEIRAAYGEGAGHSNMNNNVISLIVDYALPLEPRALIAEGQQNH